MRISKETAKNIACELLQKKKKEVEAYEKEISKTVTAYYEKLLPKAVIAFGKKFPEYVQYAGSIHIDNGFFRWRGFTLTKRLPCFEGTTTLRTLEPEFNKKLQSMCNKLDQMKTALRELHEETTGTILALGTTKRIEESFPEAAKLLPADSGTTMALAVNVESLRKRIA